MKVAMRLVAFAAIALFLSVAVLPTTRYAYESFQRGGWATWWLVPLTLFVFWSLLDWIDRRRGKKRMFDDLGSHLTSRGGLRSLISAQVGFAVFEILVALRTEPDLPTVLRDFVNAQSFQFGFVILALLVMLLYGVSVIGMMAFWAPARWLFFYAMLSSSLMEPFGGPYVETGWETLYQTTSLMLAGFILAMVFFSPAKVHFEHARAATMPA